VSEPRTGAEHAGVSPGPRSVVVHGHFYQPPREDPWTGEVPREPSAAPYHDWNARIEAECYGPVTSARILDAASERRVNCLEWMSFDVGPTLLSWMERRAPETYRRIVEADRASARRQGGAGNALAMPYHHVILPLATRRDKVTEVRWGLADFRRRFGREAEGLWLPEAAVDDETLDVLAAEGVRFTILGPGQVEAPPPGGRPGRYRTRNGREIAIFVYDGELAHDLAFGRLARDADAWLERVAGHGADRLVLAATDGETFGHHHRFAEMGLAAFLDKVERRPGLRLESLAAFLDRSPAEHEVELIQPSSWSCVHGVDRWRLECGCKLHPARESRQTWRAPLRQGLEALAQGLHRIFEEEAGRWFEDPWEVRDASGEVEDRTGELPALVARHARRALDADELRRAGELLEMERNALRMFTSCGWFFDDLARIEALKVLGYAARAVELAGPREGAALELELVTTLAGARSNDPLEGTGADLYLNRVKGGRGPLGPGPAEAGVGDASDPGERRTP